MLAHDVADVLPHGVHEVLAVVGDHPLGQERAAARDDADQAVADIGQVFAEHAGVDGEIVDALLGLAGEGLADDGLVEVFDLSADDHRIDRHRADGDGRVLDDGNAGGVEVAAGGEIHDGVGAPALGPVKFLDLFVGGRGDGAGAHVGVDLGLGRPADGHGVELVAQVIDVGGDDHAPGGDFVAHLLGRQVGLALGHPAHLGRDQAQAGVFELGDGGECGPGRSGQRDGADRAAFELGKPVGEAAFAVRRCGLDGPAGGEEVPGGLVAGGGHAGRIGRRKRPGRADARGVGERAGGGAGTRRGRVVSERRERVVDAVRGEPVAGGAARSGDVGRRR